MYKGHLCSNVSSFCIIVHSVSYKNIRDGTGIGA